MADNEEDKTSPTTNDVGYHPVEQHPEYWRFHIPHDQFGWTYSHIKQLGWTYSPTLLTYQAPPGPDGTPGQVFNSAEAVTDYLNSFAIPNVYTNLQWATSTEDVSDDSENTEKARQEREIGLALRKAILARSYDRDDGALDKDDRFGSSSESEEDGSSSDNARKEEEPSNGCGTHRRRSSRFTNTAKAVDTSRTVAEKGTDLYLRRKTRGANKKNKSTVSSSRTTTTSQRLTLDECREFLQTNDMDQVEQIEETFHTQFPRWRFLLSTNHSLLFYGAGSKRALLNSFAEEELQKEGESLVIDGADEEVSMDRILDLLVQMFFDGIEPTDLAAIPCHPAHVSVIGKFCPWKADPTVERAIMVGRGLAHQVEQSNLPLPPTFLVIHSLDARLAKPVAQQALAALVTNSTVANGVAALRLVASVNHVDAPTFLWDTVTEANFSWFPCCVHTHRPFVHELNTIDEDTAYRKKTERADRTNTQADRILDVLQGLAPRHTEVVQLLAQLQTNENEWVDYLQYRDRCKSACAVNKDSQLRQLMKELMDHGLVASKTQGSNEFVQIPFSTEKIQEIIDFERGS